MKHLRTDYDCIHSEKLLDIPYGGVFIPSNMPYPHMKVNNGKHELQDAIDLTNGLIRKFSIYDYVVYFPDAYYGYYHIPELLED